MRCGSTSMFRETSVAFSQKGMSVKGCCATQTATSQLVEAERRWLLCIAQRCLQLAYIKHSFHHALHSALFLPSEWSVHTFEISGKTEKRRANNFCYSSPENKLLIYRALFASFGKMTRIQWATRHNLLQVNWPRQDNDGSYISLSQGSSGGCTDGLLGVLMTTMGVTCI